MTTRARPRILILSSATGSGHDTRARAFARWVEHLAPGEFEVRQEQVIENGSRLGAFGVWFYNLIQRRWPGFHTVYWEVVERIIGSQATTVSMGGRYYRGVLREFAPDLVFSVHDSTNRGYFQDAKATLGPQVVTGTYCGEWSGGPGYSANWVEPTADFFWARTEEALAFAHEVGLPRDRGAVLQNFIPPGGFVSGPVVTRGERRRSLGLEADRFTILIAAGGQGANHHLRILEALHAAGDWWQAIVVCGADAKAARRVGDWSRRHAGHGLVVEGNSPRVLEHLATADVVVTRGGANTAAEACARGCVPVFHTLGGRMPQERLTIDYFTEKGAAFAAGKVNKLVDSLRRLANDRTLLEETGARLRGLDRKDTPEPFVLDILAQVRHA